jgi:hypothetical protein
MSNIKIITASHDHQILTANLLKSEMASSDKLTAQINYTNIPFAYNLVTIPGSTTIYVHHDVFLPKNFYNSFLNSLYNLNQIDPNWGVLGVAGVKLVDGKKQNIGHIQDRGREWGSPVGTPAEVDTLDELLLITHGDLEFDMNFDLHFYGADICMQAKLQGRKCYAINAYCHHNSGLPLGHRSQSFRDCEAKFRAKYINHLPIVTTCSMLT